jgi:hypothetical protein
MHSVQFMLVSLCKKNGESLKPGDPEFNAKLNSNLDLCILSDEYNFAVDKPLIPRLDEFYKEPLNARITPNMAMVYVRDELKERKTAGQLLDELNDWRKTMNRNTH